MPNPEAVTSTQATWQMVALAATVTPIPVVELSEVVDPEAAAP
jgi:hypothetical protein